MHSLTLILMALSFAAAMVAVFACKLSQDEPEDLAYDARQDLIRNTQPDHKLAYWLAIQEVLQ